MSRVLSTLPRHKVKLVGVLTGLCLIIYFALYSSFESYDFDIITDVKQSGSEPLTQAATPNVDNAVLPNTPIPIPKTPESEPEPESPLAPSPKPVTAHVFWKQVFEILDKYKLDLGEDPSKAVHYIPKEKQIQGDDKTKEILLSKAEVSAELIKQLKEKHHGVVEELPEMMPSSVYNKGTKGVVIIGGTRFSWLAYLALVALRETGSKLPVEIVMPVKKDYERETEFCEKILPDLNAKCVVVPDVFGEEVMKGRKFSSYQFKALALVVSSFEHILLLDSDNMILTNPDEIFESKLYKDYGMITWPDYWKRTISPIYYDLAEIEVNENKRVRYNRFPLYVPPGTNSNLDDKEKAEVPYHDLEGTISDLSTESGQLMINKRTHGETILLTLYYNNYGPNLFYKLFSLGEQGEGDKDTFVAAAISSGQKYYQVKSFIRTYGYADKNDKFQGVAMGQKNPLLDHEAYEKVVLSLEDEATKKLTIPEQIEKLKTFENEVFHQHNSIPLFSLHCNYPKLDPVVYMSRDDLYVKEKKRLNYKLYGGLTYDKKVLRNGELESVKTDFEQEQWEHMHDILCVKRIHFVHFSDTDLNELCEFINNQVKWLEMTDN